MRLALRHSFRSVLVTGLLAAVPGSAGAAAKSPIDLPVFARIDRQYQSGAVAAGLGRADTVLTAARAARDARLESAALVYRAIGLNWSRDYRGALALVDARMPTLRAQRDGGVLATAQLTRGYALDLLGRPDEAATAFTRAATLAAAAGREREVAYARLRLGFHWLQMGRASDAAREYRFALAAATAPALAGVSATAHVGLGNALSEQGDVAGAQREYYAAISRSRAAGDLVDEADALFNLGTLQFVSGDESKCLPLLRGARELYRRLRRPEKLVSAARTLAIAELSLGHGNVADSLLEATRRELGNNIDPASRGRLLAQQGVTRLQLGRVSEARAAVRQALRFADSASVSVRCEIAFAASNVFGSSGSPDSALAIVEAQLALPEVQRSGRPRRQMELARAGDLAGLGRVKESADALRACLASDDAVGFRTVGMAGIAAALGRVQRTLGHPDSAATYFEIALDRWEAGRQTATGPDWREALDTEAVALAFDYVGLLLAEPSFGTRTARVGRAFDVVQRFRSRALMDRRTARAGPRAPIGCGEFRRKTLRPGEVFLEILHTADSSYVFAISRDSVSAWGGPGRNVFFDRMLRLRAALAGANGRDVLVGLSAGTELGRSLLGPGARRIAQAHTVIVSAGGSNNLPWGALVLPGETEPLTQGHVMSTCPSATLLDELRHDAGAGRGTLVAACAHDADERSLPGVIREARSIVGVWSGARLIRDRQIGGGAGLLARARDADIVHIAAHARSDNYQGWTQALLVGDPNRESDWLDAMAVAKSHTRARLCVLSACGSIGSKWGESVHGLAAAWLIAGARCVVATQWSIDDESTPELMTRFHRGMAAGLTAGEALRRAQGEMRAIPRYAGPAHWAGVVLVGDPAVRVAAPRVAAAGRP